VAVELDDALAAFLRRDIDDSGRLTVIQGDARYLDVERHVGSRPYLVVANLPYSVATVIIRRFLDGPHRPDEMHVMVQREVAERMTARPPDMSLLGLACQLDTEPAIAFTVPADAFLPAPKVESAVVSMRVIPEPALSPGERETLFRLATMAFQRRRKTLANGLSQGLAMPKGDIERFLAGAGIDPMRRPETLAAEDWLRLTARVMS
jgi:16S rRNA (adenine1518-N6/adenine1519-N6)-dimethyltransferase